MPDRFDPYREALVLETETLWSDEAAADVPVAERATFERRLHAEASEAEHIDYIRLHTGFQRRITVMAGDVERLRSS